VCVLERQLRELVATIVPGPTDSEVSDSTAGTEDAVLVVPMDIRCARACGWQLSSASTAQSCALSASVVQASQDPHPHAPAQCARWQPPRGGHRRLGPVRPSVAPILFAAFAAAYTRAALCVSCSDSMYPDGHYIRSLGPVMDLETEVCTSPTFLFVRVVA
jgi:hypothetical protein